MDDVCDLSVVMKMKIDEIFGEGGGEKSADTFYCIAVEMLDAGCEHVQVLDWLKRLYWATAGDFGA